MRYADKIPYVFILDHLPDVEPVIKPMFGCYAIYVGGKLCLFMLNREKPILPAQKNPGDQNGVYIATTAENCDSLREEFPEAAFQMLKAGKVWIFVSQKSDKFEEYSIRAAEMINAGDPRVGR